MNATPLIRAATQADSDALEALYRDAFPDENLAPLLRALAAEPRALSLVATANGAVNGHVALTRCDVTDGDAGVGLLGPLAVASASRRRGLGAALVDAACERARGSGMVRVLVLGDPSYYGRHGFAPERSIAPPYPLPPEWGDAWQSLALVDAVAPKGALARGTLVVPAPWRPRALWAP